MPNVVIDNPTNENGRNQRQVNADIQSWLNTFFESHKNAETNINNVGNTINAFNEIAFSLIDIVNANVEIANASNPVSVLQGGIIATEGEFLRNGSANLSNSVDGSASSNVPRFQLGKTSYVYSPDTIKAKNQQAVVASAALAARDISQFQPLINGINILIVYGQSNGAGTQSFKPLTTEPVPGCYMLGDSSHATPATTFTPVGIPTLNPLIATTLNGDRTGVITPTQADALDYNLDNNLGEHIGILCAHRLRKAIVAQSGLENDPREILVVNLAEPGSLAANLARGAASNFFNRIPTAIAAIKAAASAVGKNISVLGLIVSQGEADCEVTAAATWKAIWQSIYNDTFTYGVVPNLPAQTLKPCLFFAQIAGLGVIGNDNLVIPNATLELSVANNWPIIPRVGTAKGLHHDINGTRETSVLLSRALIDVYVNRNHHITTAPYIAGCSASKNEVLITFTAPAGMVFKPYYQYWTATDRADRGLRLTDNSGVLTQLFSEWVGSHTLRIVVSRDLVGTLNIGAGFRNTSGGNTNLKVQNDEATGYFYEFSNGMNTLANIVGKVGTEIDSGDACCLFSVNLTVV